MYHHVLKKFQSDRKLKTKTANIYLQNLVE